MGLYLHITATGMTDIDLLDADVSRGVRYNPNADPVENAMTVDTIELVLYGLAVDMLAFRDSIQARLDMATRRQQKKAGPRVYLKARQNDNDDYFQSEIIGGVLEWTKRPPTQMLRAGLAELIITVQRENHWDAATATALPLTNRNGTDATTGLTVNNSDDADADNFVTISGSDIPGSIPGPAIIYIHNTATSGVNLGSVWMALNAHSSPSSYSATLEAEDGSAAGGHTLTPTSDANASGGSYATASWPDDDIEDIVSWTLSAAFLAKCAGNIFKMLLATYTAVGVSQSTWFQFQVRTGSTTLGETPWTRVQSGDAGVLPIGNLRLPPGVFNDAVTSATLTLVLRARSESTGTHNLIFDFVFIAPLDGYRNLVNKASGVVASGYLLDDGYNGYLHSANSSGAAQLNNYSAVGKPIMLIPGVDQRIYFINEAITPRLYPSTGQFSVVIQYRERRLLL